MTATTIALPQSVLAEVGYMITNRLGNRTMAHFLRTIAAVAERLNITRILTLDRRDFQMIRPKRIEHFEILP